MSITNNLRKENLQKEEIFDLIDKLEENYSHNFNDHFRKALWSYNAKQHSTDKQHSINQERYSEDTISCLIDATNSHVEVINQSESFTITFNAFLMGFIEGMIAGAVISQIGASTCLPTHKYLSSIKNKLLTTMATGIVGGGYIAHKASDIIELKNFHHEACICKNNAYQAELMGELTE